VKSVPETITNIGTLEQHPKIVGLSRFVTVWRVNWEWVKRKVVSGVLRKCVWSKLCLWQHHAKAQIHKIWSWNFLCKLWARNRNVLKI